MLVLPSLEDKTGFVKNVFGDWEIASIVAAASGQAVSVYTRAVSPASTAVPTGTGFNDNNRPNRVPGRVLPRQQRQQGADPQPGRVHAERIPARHASATPAAASATGPGLFQVDLSLYKNIKISKRVKAQLRFEVFNIFNKVNFLGTDATFNHNFNPSSVTYNTNDPATATSITGFTVPNNFGQADARRAMRARPSSASS